MYSFFFVFQFIFRILVKKDENWTSIRTENILALLIPNHFVLDDCPRDMAPRLARKARGPRLLTMSMYRECDSVVSSQTTPALPNLRFSCL